MKKEAKTFAPFGSAQADGPVLRLEGLGVALPRGGHVVRVLEDVSLSVAAGEMLALVGESGSGKSVAALSVPGLLPAGAVVSGGIWLGGTSLLGPGARGARGRRIGVVFQDPAAALNPVMRVGAQIAEPLRLHLGMGRRAAWDRAVALLEEVGIEDAGRRAGAFPHQFSGGMRQRVMIACALACGPELLIADEPTSGLDGARAEQILALLGRLRAERRMAVLLVSHDLAQVRRHADRVAVLYAGRVVERGAAGMLAGARHPYTRALLRAAPMMGVAPVGIAGQLPEPEARGDGCLFLPRCGLGTAACAARPGLIGDAAGAVACWFPEAGAVESVGAVVAALPAAGEVVLQVDGLGVRYASGVLGRRGGAVVSDVSFSLRAGECLAVVGESGSGKTSLGRAVLQMIRYEGVVKLRGVALGELRGGARRAARRRLGVVFQNPVASLNPLLDVAALVGEALVLGGVADAGARRARVVALLEAVGLPAALLGRRAGSLSGGQAQRVAIARALACEPDVLVLDEPTASLDVSTQAVVLNLLRELMAARGFAMIVITHDLAAVRFMAHRVMVMTAGGSGL